MGFLWVFYGDFMGTLWDFEWISQLLPLLQEVIEAFDKFLASW
jgi:hypothetical protein